MTMERTWKKSNRTRDVIAYKVLHWLVPRTRDWAYGEAHNVWSPSGVMRKAVHEIVSTLAAQAGDRCTEPIYQESKPMTAQEFNNAVAASKFVDGLIERQFPFIYPKSRAVGVSELKVCCIESTIRGTCDCKPKPYEPEDLYTGPKCPNCGDIDTPPCHIEIMPNAHKHFYVCAQCKCEWNSTVRGL